MVGTNSTDYVMATMDHLLFLYDDQSEFYCHPMAHHMGEFLFGYLEGDLRAASDLADYRCARGMMHGILENTIQIENMLHNQDIEDVDIKQRCDDIREYLGKSAQRECAHGIGHSVINIYDYNTTKAVQRCNDFDIKNDIVMCNGGLFMQNMGEYAKNRGGDFSDTSLYYPCNQFETNDAASSMCYRYQANYFLSKTSYNIEESKELCLGIDDKRYIPICMRGIASHLAKNNFADIEKTKIMCDNYPDEYQNQCIKGSIESLTRFVSEDKAEKFCQIIDEKYTDICLIRYMQLLDNRE